MPHLTTHPCWLSACQLRMRIRACGRSHPGLRLTRLYSWSVGSLMFLSSWAVLMGPMQYAMHLISGPRLPFTAAYFGSIIMTIYFAVGVSPLESSLRCCKTLLTLPSAPLDNLDSIFGDCAARGFGVVFGQLLPNGKHWIALCCQGRRQPGKRMDERLRHMQDTDLQCEASGGNSKTRHAAG
jgi:hypothetical protein